jgi:flagellar biosynthesis protein FlhB
MAEGGQSEDRTEAATARHLELAREEGQVPVSREVAVFAGLAAVVLVLGLQSQFVLRRLIPEMIAYLAHSGDGSMFRAARLQVSIENLAAAAIPTLLAAAIAGGGIVLIQTKFLLHLGALQPKASRANPMSGLKRVFGFDGVIEMVKSLAKLGLLTTALWVGLAGDWNGLVQLTSDSPKRLLTAIARPALHLLVAGVVAQGIIAAADFGWVRFRHARDMRMSKQDVRDELKETDGNPHVKARLRSIRVMRARRRMMEQVPKATVVVTNPTHFAVALAYDKAVNPAPRVVAKGMDSLAARIRQVAEANRVPVVANPPLARTLYRLELDTEIPAEHYKAVAEIIAYIWRLRQKPGVF